MINLFDSHTASLDSRLFKVCLVIARLGLGFLFFTQLWWKLPPRFGCGADFAFPVPAEQNYWDANKSSGLCYWMGLESIFASQPRKVLVADMRPAGLPTLSVSITPITRLNGVLLDNLFIPQIQVFGWLIWLGEFWIALSMLLGLFTRLGALVSIGMSLQLYIGLANIPRPFEWEWSYGTIVLLSVAMLGAVAGRTFGVDGWLRRKLADPAERGNRLAKIGLFLS
ncbi:MAG: DoxX family protein [Anaerolineales bacterium]|jgi:uncharacterized membrane protein YphA (DoxX/SURF4 family)